MKNSHIAARLYDMALSNERLIDCAQRVEAAGRDMAAAATAGAGWSKPIDSNGFTQLIQAQKDVEMREALALAVGATNDQVREAYAHQQAGDLMRWLEDEFPSN